MSKALDQFVDKSRRSRERFLDTARREEALAQSNPKGYRLRVSLFANLAYAYFFAVFVLLVLMLAGLVWFVVVKQEINTLVLKVGLALVLVLVALVRSIWVKIPPPEGVELARQDAPELFRQVAAIAKETGAPDADHILIVDEVNAAAAQIPRFGMVGPARNYLILGLPLMLTTTEAELLSVIAHEFGHFSGQHSRFSGRIYRLNQTCERISWLLNRQNGRGLFLVAPFVRWFQPRLHALSFALCRQNEYEADATAARLYGAETFASALLRIQLASRHLDRAFWQPLSEQAKQDPEPPADVFASMAVAARRPIDPEVVDEGIAAALSRKTDYTDTHPSFSDRLKALGVSLAQARSFAASRDASAPTAAEALLGGAFPKVSQSLQARTKEAMRKRWRLAHEEHAKAMERLEEMDAKYPEPPTDRDGLSEVAFVRFRALGAAAAEPVFRHALERFPNDPELLFGLGEVLLDLRDGEGVAMIERSLQANPGYEGNGLDRLGEYYAATNDLANLERVRERAYAYRAREKFVDRQMKVLKVSDQFVASGLSKEVVAQVTSQLARRKDVGRAYWVAKTLPEAPGRKRLVLVVLRPTFSLNAQQTAQFQAKIIQELRLPVQTLVYVPEKAAKWRRRLDPIPGSLIFDKSG